MEDQVTFRLAAGGFYLFSYGISARLQAGGWLRVLPVLGQTAQPAFSATVQGRCCTAPATASGSFLFYAPAPLYLRLRLEASCPVRPCGSFSIVRVADCPLGQPV